MEPFAGDEQDLTGVESIPITGVGIRKPRKALDIRRNFDASLGESKVTAFEP
jgi:hypothetical protein